MNALKRWRTGLGWTQQQAAEHCGVRQQTFARAEEGAVSVETAANIAARTDGAVSWPDIFEKRVGAAFDSDDTDPVASFVAEDDAVDASSPAESVE